MTALRQTIYCRRPTGPKFDSVPVRGNVQNLTAAHIETDGRTGVITICSPLRRNEEKHTQSHMRRHFTRSQSASFRTHSLTDAQTARNIGGIARAVTGIALQVRNNTGRAGTPEIDRTTETVRAQ